MNTQNRLLGFAVAGALSLGLSACNLWDGSKSTPTSAPASAPATYTISGSVSGLASGQQVSLQNNGGDTLNISANGSFAFATPVSANGSYSAVVSGQPDIQTCSVASGSGSNVSANVANVTVSCSSHNVYVSDAANSQILQFAVKHDGTLTPLSSAAVATAGPTSGIAIDPSGKHLYATLFNLNEVEQFDIGNDGSLTPMATPTVSTGLGPYQVVVSADDKYLFVGNQGEKSVTSFSIASDGSLSAIGTYPCSSASNMTTNCSNTQGLAVDSSTSHLYVAGAAFQNIITMTIGSDGSLSNPVGVSGPGSRALAIDSTGSLLLAAYHATMKQFTISPTDGSLSPYNTYTLTGNEAETMAFDPSGMHLYLSMSKSSTVDQFSYDSSGTPTPLAPASVSAGASQMAVYGVVIDPSGSYGYTLNRGSDDISQFLVGSDGSLSVNPVSGVVSLPSSPSPDPISIAIK